MIQISSGWKKVCLFMVQINNWIWKLEARLFGILTNGSHFVKTNKNSDFNVCFYDGLCYKTGPLKIKFHIWSSRIRGFIWSDFRSPLSFFSAFLWDFSVWLDLTQSKSKTIITRCMCVISLIICGCIQNWSPYAKFTVIG